MVNRFRSKLIPRAKELRKDATPQENRLWYDFLRNYPVKVRRQAVIGGYIADFYCPKAKLVIEIDGSQHFSPDGIRKDSERSQGIETVGCKVIRFSNYEVNTQFDSVCEAIDLEIKARMK